MTKEEAQFVLAVADDYSDHLTLPMDKSTGFLGSSPPPDLGGLTR